VSKVVVEVLYFEGCPNAQAALELVQHAADELGLDVALSPVEVGDAETATARRFLGSPTIRVNGGDVEPGAGDRSNYTLSCRVYRTEAGLAAQPDERWVKNALLSAA
jgi:hypothetical protein